ncbi:MAG: hypothetical protein QOJ89_3444 [bacterium]|jgi:hypothetical protein
MSTSTPSRASLGKRALAVLILLVAAWIIVKAVIGIAVAVFWAVLVVAAVCALIWAVRVL